ncbi:hypothetical protein AAG570_007114 [Ranatra chinensis]|uniref:Tim44-like domain-containing protein n=1 Tax=Ranatra chinensis TaxID=642074 RepID=A0ABD0Y830_9HEMI
MTHMNPSSDRVSASQDMQSIITRLLPSLRCRMVQTLRVWKQEHFLSVNQPNLSHAIRHKRNGPTPFDKLKELCSVQSWRKKLEKLDAEENQRRQREVIESAYNAWMNRVEADKPASADEAKIKTWKEWLSRLLAPTQKDLVERPKLRRRRSKSADTKESGQASEMSFKPLREVTDLEKAIAKLTTLDPTLPATLNELVRLDPNYNTADFELECKHDLIPNIMGAALAQDAELVRDWCTGPARTRFEGAIARDKKEGLVSCSSLLWVDFLRVSAGRLTESGPVVDITFTATLVLCERDRAGRVVKGDPDDVRRVGYVWSMHRDPDETDPKAAWRLCDFKITEPETFF